MMTHLWVHFHSPNIFIGEPKYIDDKNTTISKIDLSRIAPFKPSGIMSGTAGVTREKYPYLI
jgi:hypothetical protein